MKITENRIRYSEYIRQQVFMNRIRAKNKQSIHKVLSYPEFLDR